MGHLTQRNQLRPDTFCVGRFECIEGELRSWLLPSLSKATQQSPDLTQTHETDCVLIETIVYRSMTCGVSPVAAALAMNWSQAVTLLCRMGASEDELEESSKR